MYISWTLLIHSYKRLRRYKFKNNFETLTKKLIKRLNIFHATENNSKKKNYAMLAAHDVEFQDDSYTMGKKIFIICLFGLLAS